MSAAISAVRGLEIRDALANVQKRISVAKSTSSHQNLQPCLVAVSKFKPASDIAAAYEAGQRDFGENYVNEIIEKAPILPPDIRWHFIGHLQSNKAKALAGTEVEILVSLTLEIDIMSTAIPNLYALHTLTSIKLATALNKARSPHPRLNVLLQVNTSGEPTKSGLLPPATLAHDSPDSPASLPEEQEELVAVARHVINNCPNLHLTGLMTIGSLDNSMNTDADNPDFQSLLHSRGILEQILTREFPLISSAPQWGDEHGRLVLSMGMSSDFEAAIRAGSGIVRVGSSIFGERQK